MWDSEVIGLCYNGLYCRDEYLVCLTTAPLTYKMVGLKKKKQIFCLTMDSIETESYRYLSAYMKYNFCSMFFSLLIVAFEFMKKNAFTTDFHL